MNFKKIVKGFISRAVPLTLAGTVTVCILHPSLWIGFLWTILHGLVVLGILGIVCRVMFKKGLIALIKEGLNEPKEEKEE